MNKQQRLSDPKYRRYSNVDYVMSLPSTAFFKLPDDILQSILTKMVHYWFKPTCKYDRATMLSQMQTVSAQISPIQAVH